MDDVPGLFFIDKNPTGEAPSVTDASPPHRPTSAWQDSDDEQVEVDVQAVPRLKKLRRAGSEQVLKGQVYEQRLRAQFEKLHPQPKWAQRAEEEAKTGKAKRAAKSAAALPSPADSDDDETGPSSSSPDLPVLSVRRPRTLLPGSIDLTRLKDANFAARQQSVVQTVAFHPNSELLLVGGYDATLRLFSLNGTTNPMVHSVHMEKMALSKACFTRDGRELLASSTSQRYFYAHDLTTGQTDRVHLRLGATSRGIETFALSPDDRHLVMAGPHGNLHLLSRHSRQTVTTLKMQGEARAVTFGAQDPNRLYAYGDLHEVFVWDVRQTARCLGRLMDDAGNKGTALGLASSGMLATGADSGVVNLYRPDEIERALGGVDGLAGEQPLSLASLLGPRTVQPAKRLLNLTTRIHTLAFSPDAQILAMASRSKKNAVRLVHVPSMTVFQNWPVEAVPLKYVSALDISPSGKLLALGNDAGHVQLYQFNHLH